MRAPTLHLNGSSADVLLEGYQAAVEAARQLLRSIDTLPLNPRDYYPQGATAYNEAVEDLVRLQKQTVDIGNELLKVVEAIAEQEDCKTAGH